MTGVNVSKVSFMEGALHRLTACVSELRLLAAEHKIDAAALATVLEARVALGQLVDDVVREMPPHPERRMTPRNDDRN